jgi:hypothetical protein
MKRRIAVLGAALLGVLALALPAGAAAPFRETFAESGSEPVPCDGFDAILERIITGRVSVYFDNDGIPLRAQVDATMAGSVVNVVSGKSVVLRGHIHVIDDFDSGVATWTGPVFLANDRSRGSVITDTGRVSFLEDEIVFEAGPHQAIEQGAAVFCAAVA